MKNLRLPAWLLGAAAGLGGCAAAPEPVCQSTLLVPVAHVTGPRTATVNQSVTYTLQYKLGNSCGAFSNIATSTSPNATGPVTQQVGVQANYNGCACAVDTVTISTVGYQFQPPKAGIYYVQFLTRNNAFITDTLTVQ